MFEDWKVLFEHSEVEKFQQHEVEKFQQHEVSADLSLGRTVTTQATVF